MITINGRLKSVALPEFEGWDLDGDNKLLRKKTFSVLLSRQSRRPGPAQWWIHAVKQATHWASSQGWTAITGGGLLHLDFVRWSAHNLGPTVWLDINKLIHTKSTGPSYAGELWCDLHIKPDNVKSSKRDLFKIRDRAIASLSDNLIAVAVREGGLMEQIGKQALADGKSVYAIDPPKSTKAYRGNINLLELGAAPLEIDIKIPETTANNTRPGKVKAGIDPEAIGKDYLWHFTRECPGPWPGQTWGNYFKELASGTDDSGHTGLDTLTRILAEGRIRASGRLIRGAHQVVCWTATHPTLLLDRVSYRSALVRWEFQPYAIGIKRDVAPRLGLKPAIYKLDNEYGQMPEKERYLFQLLREGSAKWAEDQEWRGLGDFQLSDLHPTEAVLLVGPKAETWALESISRFPILTIG